MYYTGIGARTTPNDVLKDMTNIASNLEQSGFILRSGGANGADSAFGSFRDFFITQTFHFFQQYD